MAEQNYGKYSLNSNLFQVTTGIFEPGTADSFCEKPDDPEKTAFGKAELSYYRGESFEAAEAFKKLSQSDNQETAAGSTLGTVLALLACDSAEEVIGIYKTIKGINDLLQDSGFSFKLTTQVFLLYFNIMIHNFGEITFPAVGLESFNVPEPLKPMAFYVYAHYLLESGDIGRAIGMAEGALLFMKKPCPISEIYLCLIISRGYMLRKLWDKAEYYFRLAWSIAEPDGLMMPFAEFRGMLSGMLENCLRYDKPAEYKIISDLSNRYHSGWVKVHNELTGERISDALTAIEFNVANLASQDLSNNEISDLLGISVNSVRAHLRNIFNKLGVSSRKELDTYVF
ncbi:MAG: helix-turn-helix transcriptional regulator [Clostridia bacterium]|nr:helix-turn-helix transcriptional regulator [Clostridia bacterium]